MKRMLIFKWSKLGRALRAVKILLYAILITTFIVTKRDASAGVGKDMENLFSARWEEEQT